MGPVADAGYPPRALNLDGVEEDEDLADAAREDAPAARRARERVGHRTSPRDRHDGV
jgi:hypothetical protein